MKYNYNKDIEQKYQYPNKETLDLQKSLNKFKVTDEKGDFLLEDGIMGVKTRSSIRKFQQIVGIDVNGEFDNKTDKAIKLLLSKPTIDFKSKEKIVIRYIQWRIKTIVDGIFGIQTQSAVIKYQSQNDLALDGVISYSDWTKLIG